MLHAAVPILRIFDEDLATAFYQEHLGFQEVFSHRFGPDLPLYRRIRRDGLTLDLSGHHGDSTPGTALWIPVDDVHALRDELHSGASGLPRPEVDADAPGGPTLSLQDPFGNELRFCQPE